MPSFSKNVEATGEHFRSYDAWRESLPSLPPGTFTPLRFIECSRVQNAQVGVDWPIFTLHCLLLTDVLERNEVLSQEKVQALKQAQSHLLSMYQLLIPKLGIPLYCAVVDYDLTTFLVQEITGQGDMPVARMSSKDFAQRVIRQRLSPGAGQNPGVHLRDRSLRYGTWHRIYLANQSYLMDIDFIEMRADRPAAVIEVTRANSGDLRKGFFDFLTRGFTQESVLLQVAERLGVPCVFVTYAADMSKLFAVQLNREVVIMSDPLSSQRVSLSQQFQRQGDDRNVAEGKACQVLYDRETGQLLPAMLKRTWSREMPLPGYRKWLEELGNQKV